MIKKKHRGIEVTLKLDESVSKEECEKALKKDYSFLLEGMEKKIPIPK